MDNQIQQQQQAMAQINQAQVNMNQTTQGFGVLPASQQQQPVMNFVGEGQPDNDMSLSSFNNAGLSGGMTGVQSASTFPNQAPVIVNNTVNYYGTQGAGYPAQGGAFPSSGTTPIGSVMNTAPSGSVLQFISNLNALMAQVIGELTTFLAEVMANAGQNNGSSVVETTVTSDTTGSTTEATETETTEEADDVDETDEAEETDDVEETEEADDTDGADEANEDDAEEESESNTPEAQSNSVNDAESIAFEYLIGLDDNKLNESEINDAADDFANSAEADDLSDDEIELVEDMLRDIANNVEDLSELDGDSSNNLSEEELTKMERLVNHNRVSLDDLISIGEDSREELDSVLTTIDGDRGTGNGLTEDEVKNVVDLLEEGFTLDTINDVITDVLEEDYEDWMIGSSRRKESDFKDAFEDVIDELKEQDDINDLSEVS